MKKVIRKEKHTMTLCNKCGKEMENIGNISHTVYATYPSQWDDTYICRGCKEKKLVREHGYMSPDYFFINDYKEQE